MRAASDETPAPYFEVVIRMNPSAATDKKDRKMRKRASSEADFNMDGIVNGVDLTLLADNWGSYAGAAAAAAAVPEPASLALLGLGALALIRRRRK